MRPNYYLRRRIDKQYLLAQLVEKIIVEEGLLHSSISLVYSFILTKGYIH